MNDEYKSAAARLCETIHDRLVELLESDEARGLSLDDKTDRLVLRLMVSNALVKAAEAALAETSPVGSSLSSGVSFAAQKRRLQDKNGGLKS